MSGELLSDDHVARQRWPVLFWANRAALGGAGVCLVGCVSLIAYQAASHPPAETQTVLNGVEGAVYVLTAVFGVAFVVTGYIRLLKVHRLSGRPRRTREITPRRRFAGIIGSLVVLVPAILAGWVHLEIGTLALFAVVFGIVYLAMRWA